MIPEELRSAFPSRILSSQPLGGGSINQVFRVITVGGSFCLKYNRMEVFPGMFEAEAIGLRLLASCRCIRVPEVIHTGASRRYSYLVLEYIEPGKRVNHFMTRFGLSLAALHRNYHNQFGLDHDNYMGALPQSNCRHDDWISFFIEERLEKQVRLAQNSGLLERKDINRFERLYTLFDTLIPKEQPSLIHGDLWGGNYLCSTAAEPYLIDPAAHYGHRESDLAMTTLFGGFSTEFYTAYHEAYPIEKGWEGRLDLYNLYPLLIHLNLFGPSYHGSIRIILQRFS